jgi:uncharacterized membrane protein YphA (DoxX/SURF4 family)
MGMLALTGRMLFVLPWFVFGLGHFSNAEMMAGMVPTWVPASAMIWVYLMGLVQIVASVMVAFNFNGWMGACVLALVGLTYALTIHLPGMMQAADSQMRMMYTNNLFKDAALAGGAMVIAAYLHRKHPARG